MPQSACHSTACNGLRRWRTPPAHRVSTCAARVYGYMDGSELASFRVCNISLSSHANAPDDDVDGGGRRFWTSGGKTTMTGLIKMRWWGPCSRNCPGPPLPMESYTASLTQTSIVTQLRLRAGCWLLNFCCLRAADVVVGAAPACGAVGLLTPVCFATAVVMGGRSAYYINQLRA